MPPRKKAAPAARKAAPAPPPERLETLLCSVCKQDWTRPVTKGGKPKLCPQCREDPTAVKRIAEQSAEQARKAAAERVDNLMINLRSHPSAPPRDYSLSRILDRLEALEAWVAGRE